MQSEEILPLADENDHPDARREAGDHGFGDEFDNAAQPGKPKRQENHAGHEGGDLQTGDAVLRGDDGQDGNESAGGARYLQARTAEQRRQETRDDGRVNALFRARAAGYRECHGERQGDDTHHQARHEVVADVASRP